MMHTGLPLQLFDHTGDISRSLQYLYTQCQRCDSVDGNTLMDRQDIRPVLCDDLQHIRQNSRFVIHLESQRDGRTLAQRALHGNLRVLHLRAVLGRPIPAVTFERLGATAVVLSPLTSPVAPRYEGSDRALASDPRTDVRIFGKPSARVNRRMGIVVGYAPLGDDLDVLRGRVKAASAEIKVLEP